MENKTTDQLRRDIEAMTAKLHGHTTAYEYACLVSLRKEYRDEVQRRDEQHGQFSELLGAGRMLIGGRR